MITRCHFANALMDECVCLSGDGSITEPMAKGAHMSAWMCLCDWVIADTLTIIRSMEKKNLPSEEERATASRN